MKKLLTIFLCVGMALMFTSCATFIDGKTELISVDSNVKGARVYINNKNVGTTPYLGTIKKSRNAKSIKVVKDGYYESTAALNSSFNPVSFLDVYSLSSTTDFLNGAMWKYDPASFYVILTKVD